MARYLKVVEHFLDFLRRLFGNRHVIGLVRQSSPVNLPNMFPISLTWFEVLYQTSSYLNEEHQFTYFLKLLGC